MSPSLRAFKGVPMALLALVACTPATAAEPSARLKNGKGAPTSTMREAYYDRDTGSCTDGSLQLMSKDRLAGLKTAWNDAPATGVCQESGKKSMPHRASYPRGVDGKRMVGAAHLLVQLEKDGSIALAEPVCATDEAFAAATLATVRAISFTPRVCDGVPVRSTFLLPFAYNP